MLNQRVPRTTSRRARLSAAAGIALVTIAAVGFGVAAQEGGRFRGSIVDPSNSVVPRATITVTSVATGVTQQVQSDESGLFEFPTLAAGDYVVEAKLPGFMALKADLTITGADVQRKLALQLGTLSETITVSFDPAEIRRTETPPAPRPPVVRTPQACSAAQAGGNIRPPRKLLDVKPVYPASLLGTGTAGTVLLQARIGADGDVKDVQVTRPAHADLNAAAVDAVKRWQFDATLLNCVPVDVVMNVTITFVAG
jgi:TonB family protein